MQMAAISGRIAGVLLWKEPVLSAVADEIWVVKVNNSSGYELPSTGGPGTKLFYLYGTMLTVLATTGLLLKRQKKKAA